METKLFSIDEAVPISSSVVATILSTKVLSLLIDFRGVPHSGNMRTNRLLNLFTMKKHKK